MRNSESLKVFVDATQDGMPDDDEEEEEEEEEEDEEEDEFTWVVIKIMVPLLDPYYNTAPNI